MCTPKSSQAYVITAAGLSTGCHDNHNAIFSSLFPYPPLWMCSYHERTQWLGFCHWPRCAAWNIVLYLYKEEKKSTKTSLSKQLLAVMIKSVVEIGQTQQITNKYFVIFIYIYICYISIIYIFVSSGSLPPRHYPLHIYRLCVCACVRV